MIPLGSIIVGLSHLARLRLLTLRIAKALLAPTTRVEDVFFALYKWLDAHPTEAILGSIKYEGGTGTPEDSAFYEKLYNVLNSPLAQKYWVQANGTVRPSLLIIQEQRG